MPLKDPAVQGVVLAQILTALFGACGYWLRERGNRRNINNQYRVSLSQIRDEIQVIDAWLKAYRQVAPAQARDEASARARYELERAYSKLAGARALLEKNQHDLASPRPQTEPRPQPGGLAQPGNPVEQRVPGQPQSPHPQQFAAQVPRIPTYLVANILTTIFCFPGSLITGVIGIFYSSRAGGSLRKGDLIAARHYSARAFFWFWFSLGTGFIFFVLYLVAASTTTSSNS